MKSRGSYLSLYPRKSLSLLLFFAVVSAGLVLSPTLGFSFYSAQPAFGQAIPEAETETITAENTLAPPLTPDQEQQIEQQQDQQPASDPILLTSIELLELVDKAGDASLESSYLRMSPGAGDEECCQLIQYTPGPLGVAGITFKENGVLDLSNAKRVVFFAMGQKGGETMKFLAAGRTSENSSLNNGSPTPVPSSVNSSTPLPEGIFSDKQFGKVTQDVVLEKNWNRYQISLEGLDLNDITDPFGFVVTSVNSSGAPVTFNLKGVTYDTKPATDPLNTLEGNSTLSSSNSTNLSSPSNSTEFAPSNSTNLSSPSNSTEFAPSNSTNLSSPSNSTEFAPSNSTNLSSPSNSTEFAPSVLSESQAKSTDLDRNGKSAIQIQKPDLVGNHDTIESNDNNSSASDVNPSQNPTLAPSNRTNTTSTFSEPVPGLTSALSTDKNEISHPIPPFVSSSFLPANFSSLNLTVAQQLEPRSSNSLDTGPPIINDQSSSENLSRTSVYSFEGTIPSDNQEETSSIIDPAQSDPLILTNPLYPLTLNSSIVASDETLYSLPYSQLEPAQQQSFLPSEAFSPAFSDITPPDTIVPLVIDSNTGSPIQNGGVLDSGSVLSVSFEGLDETSNSVAGYQCSVDGLASYYCTSPISLDNTKLSVGTSTSAQLGSSIHTFHVSAVDAAGNVDPSPASFEWSVNNNGQDNIVRDTIAIDTKIISAVDSNNEPVMNESSISLSSSQSPGLNASYQFSDPSPAANTITFSFEATDNNNFVAGYECASFMSSILPEQIEFVPCASPLVLELPASSPTPSSVNNIDNTIVFQVRARDSSGNVESSPATFLLTTYPATGLSEGRSDYGTDLPPQPDPLLQQQLPQDPLLQQQLPQDPLLQQQLPQDPLLQQQLPQDPLLQQQLPQDPLLQQQPGITIQGPFPGTEQSGLKSQQGIIQGPLDSHVQHELVGQNILPSPLALPTLTGQQPALPSGTTIYGNTDVGTSGSSDAN
jgi:hypothetical protein